jgi:hypothetical protein
VGRETKPRCMSGRPIARHRLDAISMALHRPDPLSQQAGPLPGMRRPHRAQR